MSDNPTISLEIQLTKCFKLFDQSFNRAKYFSCIAEGIDIGTLPTDWAINSSHANIKYEMDQPDKAERERLVKGFQYFVRRYLVRDCIESFTLCLDKLCFNLLLLNNSKRRAHSGQTLYDILDDEEKKFLENFQDKGLSNKNGKTGLLRTRFGLELSDTYKKIIKGLKDIRDCLTHRNGIASALDGFSAKEQKIQFNWLTLDFYIADIKTGVEQPLKLGEIHELEEGGNICFRIIEHSKLVAVGSPLEFSSVEIYEIAQSLQWIAHNYLKQAEQKLGL